LAGSSTSNVVRDAGVGLMMLGAVALLAFMAAKVGSVGGYRNGRDVTFLFEDATGLVETAPVAAAGVKVGTVSRIEYAEGGALVTARLSAEINLFADATAAVRAKSLLGEKFVAIDPGHQKAGPLSGSRVRTLPAADIDRMAAAIARVADALDPQDVKEIAHGLAVALSDADGVGKTMPGAIRDVGRDLHQLAESLEGVSAQGTDIANRLKPILAHLDELSAKSEKTLDDLDPALKKLPGALDRLDALARRLDGLAAKADKIDQEKLKHELRVIMEEEGVYVRLSSKKVGPFKEEAAASVTPAATPSASPTWSPPRL
jgi:phospholipid/cholesterol/gamma-HCH transport system substrate-binding protein